MKTIVKVFVEVDDDPNEVGQPDPHVHQGHVQQYLPGSGAEFFEAQVGEGDQ